MYDNEYSLFYSNSGLNNSNVVAQGKTLFKAISRPFAMGVEDIV